MKIVKHYFTKNACYKESNRLTPKGFMIHSTGANNPNLCRYIDDPKNLGKNKYGNHWNQYTPDGRWVCVHGFIGLDKNKDVKVYNTLPVNIQAWHCGGSANYSHIAYEICEDDLKDEKYFKTAMDTAMQVAAYYCRKYGWTAEKVICHAEGYRKGMASNHGDIETWLKKHGKNMEWFRDGVRRYIKDNAGTKKPNVKKPSKFKPYTAKVTVDMLNIRKSPNTKYAPVGSVKKGEVYTIVGESGSWGKLKSGAGWICLKYTKKI